MSLHPNCLAMVLERIDTWFEYWWWDRNLQEWFYAVLVVCIFYWFVSSLLKRWLK